jgi:hypothetical protein
VWLLLLMMRTPTAQAGPAADSMTFTPANPLAGETFTVTVSSPNGYVYVDLGSVPATTIAWVGVDSDGGYFHWRWHAVASTAGTYTFTFYTNCVPGPCIAGVQNTVDVADSMTFTPSNPEVEEPFDVIVSSYNPYVYVELHSVPEETTLAFLGAYGSGPYHWRWRAAASAGGTYTFTFYINCPPGPGCEPIVRSSLIVNTPTPTPTPTHTPTPTDTPTSTPTPTPTPTLHHFVYLPLVVRGWPPLHDLVDAPDSCAAGQAANVGHLYRDDFDRANDNDWYRFQAVAGVTYTIQTLDLGSRADTVLELFGPDCNTLLASNDDAAPGNPASRILLTAPASATYCVDVRSYDWRVWGANTGYTFRVTAGGEAAGLSAVGGDKPAPPPTPLAVR